MKLSIPRFWISTLALAGGATLSLPCRAAATEKPVYAEKPAYAAANGFSLGYTMHRFQDDFGLGATVATPTFVHDRLRVTLGGGIAWYPYGVSNGEQSWENYGHLRLVMEGGSRPPGSPVRIYGFGGPVIDFVGERLSSKPIALGGIGGFGFEYYFMSPERDGPVSYMMELGGIGTSAKADALPGHPLFGTGFFVTVGLRWYL